MEIIFYNNLTEIWNKYHTNGNFYHKGKLYNIFSFSEHLEPYIDEINIIKTTAFYIYFQNIYEISEFDKLYPTYLGKKIIIF